MLCKYGDNEITFKVIRVFSSDSSDLNSRLSGYLYNPQTPTRKPLMLTLLSFLNMQLEVYKSSFLILAVHIYLEKSEI